MRVALFIFWPFVAFLREVQAFLKKEDTKGWVIILFFGLIGLTYMPDPGTDAMFHAERFEKYVSNGFINQFVEEIQLKLAGEKKVALLLDLTCLLISSFATSYQFLFAFWGIIYGFFFMMLFRRIDDHIQEPFKRYAAPFLFAFALFIYVPPMEAINGRFWMAYIAFLPVVYDLCVNEKNKVAYLSLLIPLIHQGFGPLAFLPAIFLLFKKMKPKNRNLVLYALVVLGISFSEFGINYVRDTARSIGGIVWSHAAGYVSERVIEAKSEASTQSTVLVLKGYALDMLIYFLLVLTHLHYFWKRRKIEAIQTFDYLFSFILLIWALQSFVSEVPSMGGRYLQVMTGIMLLYNCLIVCYTKKHFSALKILFYLVFFLHLLFIIRVWSNWTSALVITNLPWLGLFGDVWNISLLDLIK